MNNEQPESRASIQFLNGPLAHQQFLLEKAVTEIGRDRQNDIVVLDQTVSRSHARISQRNGRWVIENLSQSSYVAINQQRIEQQSLLDHNNVVHLGSGSSFVFLVSQPTIEQKPSPSDFQTVAASLPSPTHEHTIKPVVPPLSSPPPAVPAAPAFNVPHIPLHVSPAGTILAPMQEHGPSLSVSSNIHSDIQT